jgi:biotin-(acetyl-CoA carboxylase) ligase
MPTPTRELPDLPSIFAPHRLREGGDALARAVALAPGHGAGTLAWVGSQARAETAVVLEPEVPLGAARLALLAAANALADALGALGPPEAVVALRWPATLVVNGGTCGRLQLAAPPGAAEAAVPDWLVVGFEVALAFPPGHEPGHDPGRTCLHEEGFTDITGAALTAAWGRHLMAGLDRWQADGPGRLAMDFLARLLDGRDEAGLRRGIDPATGALVLEAGGTRRHLPLA